MRHTVTYDLTPGLYRTLLVANTWNQHRGALIVAVLCLVGVIAISAYGYAITGTHKVLVAWFPFLICVLVWVVMLVWWLPYRLSTNKLNRNQFQRTTLSLTNDYLLLELESGLKEQIPYKHFVKARVTDSSMILWKNYIDIVLVPADSFASKEAYDGFVQAIVPNLAI